MCSRKTRKQRTGECDILFEKNQFTQACFSYEASGAYQEEDFEEEGFSISMIHKTDLKIRTYHTDAFGHVNNARYLELLEEARWRFSEDIGLTPMLRMREFGFIIIDMQLRFRHPVSEGDTITVETSLITLGSASGEVRQTVTSAATNKKSLTSLFHFILIDRATNGSVPIKDKIRTLLLDIIEAPSK